MQNVYHLYCEGPNRNWMPSWFTILFDVPGLALGPDMGIFAGYEKDKTTWGGPEFSGLARRYNQGDTIELRGCRCGGGEWTYRFYLLTRYALSKGNACYWKDAKKLADFEFEYWSNRWTSGSYVPSIPEHLRYRIRNLAT